MTLIRENLPTVVILLTILGSIPLFIDPRLDALKTAVNSEIGASEARMNGRIDVLEVRLENLEASLNSKIEHQKPA